MNVLSLFDGKSSGYTALELAGFEVGNYYSAEIDKYAIKVSDAIHPNQIRLGDVTNWQNWDIDWASINLLLGGFPCQAWSMAGKQLGDKDERGMLFWTMLDIFKHVQQLNPSVKFLIENVKMKKEFEEYITYHTEQALGNVEKHLINSALVSAQNRNRYYWTNIKGIEQPEDRGLLLASVIEHGVVNQDKSFCIGANYFKGGNLKSYFEKNRRQLVFGLNKINDRCNAITITNDGVRPHRGDSRSSGISEMGRLLFADAKKTYTVTSSHAPKLLSCNGYRKLTPRECFRLQTVPEHYIDKILSCGVSNTQLYKIAGNGWTDEVIAHIFSYMK
jgi:DNA (cytosine-5)-methyltransferase 1/DNA (cytosine-5)-methyltransferase 3A